MIIPRTNYNMASSSKSIDTIPAAMYALYGNESWATTLAKLAVAGSHLRDLSQV